MCIRDSGKWKVAVHDNTHVYQPWEKPYYVLSQGDVYNMKTRKIEKFGNGVTPARRETDGRQLSAARRQVRTAEKPHPGAVSG